MVTIEVQVNAIILESSFCSFLFLFSFFSIQMRNWIKCIKNWIWSIVDPLWSTFVNFFNQDSPIIWIYLHRTVTATNRTAQQHTLFKSSAHSKWEKDFVGYRVPVLFFNHNGYHTNPNLNSTWIHISRRH